MHRQAASNRKGSYLSMAKFILANTHCGPRRSLKGFHANARTVSVEENSNPHGKLQFTISQVGTRSGSHATILAQQARRQT
jgi:hypothetical protein